MRDINLLPAEDRQDTQAQEDINKVKSKVSLKMILITALVLVIFIASFAAPKIYIASLDMRLTSIQNEMQAQRYTEIRKVNTDLSKISGVLDSKKDIIDSIDKQNIPVTEIINTLKHVIPSGCKPKNLEYNSKTLSIVMTLTDSSQVGEFLINANRLDFLTISESSKTLSVNNKGELSFTFNVGRKDGK